MWGEYIWRQFVPVIPYCIYSPVFPQNCFPRLAVVVFRGQAILVIKHWINQIEIILQQYVSWANIVIISSRESLYFPSYSIHLKCLWFKIQIHTKGTKCISTKNNIVMAIHTEHLRFQPVKRTSSMIFRQDQIFYTNLFRLCKSSSQRLIGYPRHCISLNPWRENLLIDRSGSCTWVT